MRAQGRREACREAAAAVRAQVGGERPWPWGRGQARVSEVSLRACPGLPSSNQVDEV